MIERMPIAEIRIGERRRHVMGDIPALARNIAEHGLLHPIIVAADNVLIAGERRLRATEFLGETDILVRRWPDLSKEERYEIELAENLDRKDLTEAERSRTWDRLATVAEEVEKEEFRSNVERNSGRGRPSEPGSLRRVAERLGTSPQTILRAKDHVAAIDAYPELEPYSQTDVLKIAAKLDDMNDGAREQVRARILTHDPEILARLTDRPPLPPGPSPFAKTADSPSVRFHKDLHELWSRLNGVREFGGLATLIAPWKEEDKRELLDEVRAIGELMRSFEQSIQESMNP